MIPAYPLQWPAGWPRSHPAQIRSGQFRHRDRRIGIQDACRRVLTELERIGVGADDIVISTNVRPRLDGLPRSESVDDVGAAVYWTDAGRARVMAIDRYATLADNLAAIAATLESMRAIERHGGAEILDRAFTGFTALPPPSAEPQWWEILECKRDASLDEIRAQYRRIAAQAHPDRQHGNTERMAAVNRAWELAQEARR